MKKEKRENRIVFRCNDVELYLLQKMCKVNGLEYSEYIRDLIKRDEKNLNNDFIKD